MSWSLVWHQEFDSKVGQKLNKVQWPNQVGGIAAAGRANKLDCAYWRVFFYKHTQAASPSAAPALDFDRYNFAVLGFVNKLDLRVTLGPGIGMICALRD